MEHKNNEENTQNPVADQAAAEPDTTAQTSQETSTPNYEQDVKDLNDKILRMAAELENMRRRNAQQATELKKYAIQDFAKEVITVLENFYLIMDNAPHDQMTQDEVLKNFFEGIKITHGDLTKVFEQNGIKRIHPLGEKFNHDIHQVVSQEESDQEPGTVLKVIQAGYTLNDRLLKEAMVVVAK